MMNSRNGGKQKQIEEEKKMTIQEHKDTLTDISEDEDDHENVERSMFQSVYE